MTPQERFAHLRQDLSRFRVGSLDIDNPVELFDRMMAILSKFQVNTVHLERERSTVVDAWEQRSTSVDWDWRPAAQFINDWFAANWSRPTAVWMEKPRGQPITLSFQDSVRNNRDWDSKIEAKWKTAIKQLGRRFGMTPIHSPTPGTGEYFILPDGKTKVRIQRGFTNGIPSSETL